jgi:hypothetical protein
VGALPNRAHRAVRHVAPFIDPSQSHSTPIHESQGCALRAFGPLQFPDHGLRHVMQEGKAAVIKIARLRIQNGERTDAVTIMALAFMICSMIL